MSLLESYTYDEVYELLKSMGYTISKQTVCFPLCVKSFGCLCMHETHGFSRQRASALVVLFCMSQAVCSALAGMTGTIG